MNPLAVLILMIVIAAGGFFAGHHVGENAQKVADQAQFDGINKELSGQKTAAADLLKTKNAENLALMAERDQLKTGLEKTREDNRKATDDLRRKYSSVGLRFQPAQAAGCRLGSGGARNPAPGTAGADATASVELPAAITAGLRQLTFDADTLADEYRKCYGYAQAVR